MATAKEISKALIDCHRSRKWRAEREFLFNPRRLDVLAIAPNGSEVVGYEIKVSLADFRSEMRNDAKRRASQDYCTQFYYVVPAYLVAKDDVPCDCGLFYYADGLFWIIKRAPGKTGTLPAEVAILTEVFSRHCEQEYEEVESLQIPNWMIGRTPNRPLLFQFDVSAVAAKMACVSSQSQVDFDGVPF